MSIVEAIAEAGSQLEDARSRQGIYRLLGHLYREEIDLELLERFEHDGTLAALQAMGLEIDAPHDTRQAWLEQLAVEFTRLFIGPGPHVSPHESVHAPDSSKLLNNERTAMVRRFISAAGFDFEPSYRGYPDHVSTEFEFMEALIGCQLAGLNDGNSDETATSLMLQQEFVNRHLADWVPAFCERVLDSSEHLLYSSLSKVTEQFIEMEKEYLDSCQLPED